jgi:hypothetical protein
MKFPVHDFLIRQRAKRGKRSEYIRLVGISRVGNHLFDTTSTMAPKNKASTMASTSKASAKEVQSKRASKKQMTETNDKNESDIAITEAEPTTTKQDGVEQVDGKEGPTFTLFSKLPLETRSKIWGMAAPDPCVVLQCKSQYYIFDILLIPVMSRIETKLTPVL